MKYLTKQLFTKNAEGTNDTQTGFTLIELIVTLAIGAIILTQAVPSFLSTIQSSHLTTETNKLVADINLARSEAIKRGVDVVVCSSADPSLFVSGTHDPDCAGANDWNTGWLVYADDNDDGSFAAANDTLIRIGEGQRSDSAIGFSTADTSMSFSAEGLLNDATARSIIICYSGETSSSREVLVSVTGRPRLNKDIAACS